MLKTDLAEMSLFNLNSSQGDLCDEHRDQAFYIFFFLWKFHSQWLDPQTWFLPQNDRMHRCKYSKCRYLWVTLKNYKASSLDLYVHVCFYLQGKEDGADMNGEVEHSD